MRAALVSALGSIALLLAPLLAPPAAAAADDWFTWERSSIGYRGALIAEFASSAADADLTPLRHAAKAAYARRDWMAAARGFERIVAGDPDDFVAWVFLARARAKALPGDPEALLAAGNAYLKAATDLDRAAVLTVLHKDITGNSKYARLAASLAARQPVAVHLERLLETYLEAFFGSLGVDASAAGEWAVACVTFTRPLARVRLDDYVEVRPAVPDLALRARGRKLCLQGLAFGAEYTIVLRPGLPGADGKRLERASRLKVATPNRKPELSFRERGYVLPAYAAQVIPLRTVNVERVNIRVVRVVERNLAGLVQGSFLSSLRRWDLIELREREGSLVFDGHVAIAGQANRTVVTGLPVERLLGRRLEPSVYVIVAGRPGGRGGDWTPEATQWIVVSDIGTSLFKGPDGLHVFAQSLRSAKPLAGVAVVLVARNNRELAGATSDGAGYVHFPAPLLAGRGGDVPLYVRTDSPSAGFSFVSLMESAFDLGARGVSGRRHPGPVDAFVFTERGVYRPGETVHLTALLRDWRGRALQGKRPVTVRVRRPDGVEVDRRVLDDAGAGAYGWDLALAAGSRSGEWQASLHLGAAGPPLGAVRFLVEDFVPPRIEVAAKARAAALTPFSPFALEVSARYLFGAPAAGLSVRGEVVIRTAKTPFPGFEEFAFGLEQEPFSPERGTLEDGTLADDGTLVLSQAIELRPDTTQALVAELRLLVFEPGGRPRAAGLTLPFARPPMSLGLRPLFAQARVGEDAEARFEVVALDAAGRPLAAPGLDYTLYAEDWDTIWFRRHGEWDFETVVRERRVAAGRLDVAASAPTTIAHTVKRGRYRMEVVDPDSGAATSFRFVAGWWPPASTPDRPDALQVTLDKPAYRVGEAARVFVDPPFAGELLVLLAGRSLSVVHAGPIPEAGKTIAVTVPAGGEDGPGLYVMPIVFRAGGATGEGLPGRAMGVAWLAMDMSAERLDVALDAPSRVRPGETLSVGLRLASPGAQTFVTVAAVDEAVLRLTGFETPDPGAHFFARRRLAFEVRDTWGRLIDPRGAAPGVVRSGGGEAERRLDPGLAVRSSRVVSLFSGIVRADAGGRAAVSFEVPQFAGSLRIMAMAWNARQMGSGEARVLVRDPVVAELALPRFLAPGDRALATLSLHNVDGAAGTYEVAFSAGGPVELGGPSPRAVSLGAGQATTLALPVDGVGVGVAKISVRVSGPGPLVLEKSWNLTVRASQPASLERRLVRLAPGGSLTLPADLLRPYLSGSGRAVLSLGTVPSLGAAGLVRDLVRYQYRCLEQTTSRAMAFLHGGGAPPAHLGAEIDEAIARLGTLQRSDGSFGLWSSAC